VSAKTTVTQAHAKEKAQLLDVGVLVVLPSWTHPVISAPVDPQSRDGMTFAASPPGQLGNFSLPLLV
jgi:hypothetical protein